MCYCCERRIKSPEKNTQDLPCKSMRRKNSTDSVVQKNVQFQSGKSFCVEKYTHVLIHECKHATIHMSRFNQDQKLRIGATKIELILSLHELATPPHEIQHDISMGRSIWKNQYFLGQSTAMKAPHHSSQQ